MMIETKYECIPNELFENYLKFLIGRIYKILCMQEENNPNLSVYLEGLQRELIGNSNLLLAIRYDGDFLTLLNKIQFLIYDSSNHKIVKKEIFECIAIIKKLQTRYDFK